MTTRRGRTCENCRGRGVIEHEWIDDTCCDACDGLGVTKAADR